MPIRYHCDTCGSTLTIKDELAGTAGKCPKCKVPFIVPDLANVAGSPASTDAPTPQKPKSPKQKPAKKKAKSSAGTAAASLKKLQSRKPAPADDDFDPLDVLMGEDPASSLRPDDRGSERPAGGPLSDDELPADLDLEMDVEMDLEIGEDEGDDEEFVPRAKRKKKKRRRVQFDSDDDVPIAPINLERSTPVSRSKSVGDAAATAGAMLAGDASSGAKDLLTRTMEEGRARAAKMDEEDTTPRGPTLMDYVHAVDPKVIAGFGGVMVFAGLLYMGMSSMMGSGIDLPDMGSVYGTVTLNGQPLEGAKVLFIPSDRQSRVKEGSKQRLRTSSAITDSDGYYELQYMEGVDGAAVAEHRVVIKKMNDSGQLVTPPDFADYSRQMRTVESGSQKYNFDLTVAPPDPQDGAQPRRRRAGGRRQ